MRLGFSFRAKLNETRLDGLPFPRDHFDFVRVAGIGLGVPEDEWQSLLEVCRQSLCFFFYSFVSGSLSSSQTGRCHRGKY